MRVLLSDKSTDVVVPALNLLHAVVENNHSTLRAPSDSKRFCGNRSKHVDGESIAWIGITLPRAFDIEQKAMVLAKQPHQTCIQCGEVRHCLTCQVLGAYAARRQRAMRQRGVRYQSLRPGIRSNSSLYQCLRREASVWHFITTI
jgi:hypothetical protein